MKKKLLIDCQILQTPAFNRGMGKYSLSLMQAIFEQSDFKNTYQPVLIFNANLPKSKSRLDAIRSFTKGASKLWVDLPVDISVDWDEKYQKAEEQLTIAIKDYIKNDETADFMILSPFFVGYPAVFPQLKQVRKMSVVYDLIPYLIWQEQKIFPDAIYFKHYELFIEADHLFSISEAVKNDLVNILGIPPIKITNINGGPFKAESNKQIEGMPDQPFILFVSAPIIHKNNQRAFRGFAKFNRQNNNKYKLIVTSSFDDTTKAELGKLSDNVVFVGNVSDAFLSALYETSEVVLFASLLEGLGMPVLEAVIRNKPVACSNIDVLTEMSKEAFYLFNPLKPDEIAEELEKAITGVNWSKKHTSYDEVIAKYQWKNSAKDITTVLYKPRETIVSDKPTLAIVCPSPIRNNAAARLLEMLYAQLAVVYEVELHLTSSRGVAVPTYIPYVRTKGILSKDIPSRILLIGEKKVPNSLAKIDVPMLRINVKRSWQRHFRSRNKPEHELTLYARPNLLNPLLQLPGWNYEMNGRVLKIADVLEALKGTG